MALPPITAMLLWNAMYFLALGVSFPYFPLVLEEGGLTPSQIGLSFTLSNIMSGIFSYYMGRLSDRVGRLKTLISMTLLATASYMLLSMVRDPISTIIMFTLLMMGGGAANTAFTAYSLDVLEHGGHSRGGGFGKIRIGGSIGWVPGTFLGGALVSALGFRAVFLVSSVIVCLSVLTCYGLRESRRARINRGAVNSSLSLLRGAPGVLLLISTLSFVVLSSNMSFLSLHMINTLNTTPLAVSTAFAIMGLSEIPAMIYLGRLSDRVGRRPILLLCLAGFPLRQAITGLSGDTLVVILAQVLNGLTYGGLFVVSIAYASEIVPENMRGAYMGLYGATFSMGGVIGGYLWGSLAEATSYAIMFQYSALVSLAPLALAFLTLRIRRLETCPPLSEP
ncbi:MAG: MFS transporter [Nitrososphaerota archaeon]